MGGLLIVNIIVKGVILLMEFKLLLIIGEEELLWSKSLKYL